MCGGLSLPETMPRISRVDLIYRILWLESKMGTQGLDAPVNGRLQLHDK
jgi:hypothetical protein